MGTDKPQGNQNPEDDLPGRTDEDAPLDGDLNFATDSTPGFGPESRRKRPAPSKGTNDETENGGAPDNSENVDTEKTWVPSQSPTTHEDNDSVAGSDESDSSSSVEDTWVAPPTDNSRVGADMEETLPGPPPEPDSGTAAFEEDTWVPDDAGGAGDKSESLSDQTPTHHDFSFDRDGASADDRTDVARLEKTVNANDLVEQPFDKTLVVDSPANSDGNSAVETGTVVMPPGGDDAGFSQTIAVNGDADIDSTHIFSKTMGMRGLTEEEYDEWQSEVAEKSLSDTEVFEQPDDDPQAGSASGKRTQIWSKQTGASLDYSLTIRSRPVAGDNEFGIDKLNDQPDYQILEKLAEGGMGAIYIATQTSLGRELAIKTLKPLKEQEKKTYTNQGRMSQVVKQRREMFLSEALVTANLVHPHIIPIHDLCQTDDGLPFYSMKRVNGIPWSERIAKMGLEENLEVIHKVCDAMAYAHHNGVVNRDLKPENVMLGEFGEVLVLDWGLAVPATAADKARFTSPSASFGAGTPAYMSPELWTGPPESIGSWSDIYLLGAILFECVTGTAPHKFPEPDADSGNSGLWMIIDKVVRKNEIREVEEAGELMDIAMTAMATLPENRYRSVLEFQDAIKHFQKHEESRRLTERANGTLAEAKRQGKSGGYQNYQTAAALFEEAGIAWPENENARNGLRQTRWAYAELAHLKGDYDLGLQVAAQEQGPEFTDIGQKLTRARRIRNSLKNAMVAAVAIIVVGGVFSFYQTAKIQSLYGDVASLEVQKGDAETAKAKAQSDQMVAEKAKIDAEEQRLLAVQEKAVAEKAREAATLAKIDADKATEVAVAAQEAADEKRSVAEMMAGKAEQQRLLAEQQREVADRAKADAEMQTTIAKKQMAVAQQELASVEKQKVRAGVDLQNAKIANLIRNADYPAALRGVEALLLALREDQDLEKLPAPERQQRILELTARRQQLLKRAIATETPVQTQVISPTGNTVVWGDGEGNLIVWKLSNDDDSFPDAPAGQLQINAAVSEVKISRDENLIVAAAGKEIHLWNPATGQHEILKGHDDIVSAVKLTDLYVLAADEGGTIKSWDLKTRQPRWSIRSSAAIRDIVLMPKAGLFLYAGSRGGESSDILAYRLPPESASDQRPQRLGQLRLPRDSTYPPNRIAVSLDEQLLLVSNSRNGEVMVLPRREPSTAGGRKEFPFIHAVDLAEEAEPGWILTNHQRPVNDIAFSEDGRTVATASDDRSVCVWHRNTDDRLELTAQLHGHGAKVNAVGFLDASGNRLLSASADRFCRLWDVERYEAERKALEAEFDLSAAVSLSLPAERTPSNKTWIPAKAPLTVESQRALTVMVEEQPATADYRVLNADGHVQRGSLNSVSMNADGTRLVTGAADGTAVVWDTVTGQPVTGVSAKSQFEPASGAFEEGHDFNVARLQFLPPDGRILLTTGFDGNLCLWNADLQNSNAGHQEVRIPGLGLVNAVAVSPDGKIIVTSTATDGRQQKGSVAVWNTDELLNQALPRPTVELTGFHRAEISALAISGNGDRIVTGARDGRVAIWDTAAGERISGGQIHAKNTIVSHLQWLPDGRVLSAGFDGRIAIVRTATVTSNSAPILEAVADFAHDRIPVERVSFSPNHDRFVSISVRTNRASRVTNYELEVWDIDGLDRPERILPAVVQKRTPHRIVAANWSGDGKRLATVVDGHLQVFSTETWRVERVLDAPGLGLSDAIFAPHANPSADLVATFDGMAAHLWNLNDRSHVAAFRPQFAIQAAALSSDLDNPVLVTGDRSLRVFQADQTSQNYGQTLSKISDPHRGVVSSLSFSPVAAANEFVSAGADGSAALWKWNADNVEAVLVAWLREAGASIAETAWTNDGTKILLATVEGHFALFDRQQPELAARFFEVDAEDSVRINSAAFSNDGLFFVVAGQMEESGESLGWVYHRSPDGQPELHCVIKGHEAGGIRSVRFLPDSPHVMTGGADGAAIIWNWQPDRTDVKSLLAYEAYQLLIDGDSVAHRAPITSIAVSSTGRIATASDDGTAIVWHNPFVKTDKSLKSD